MYLTSELRRKVFTLSDNSRSAEFASTRWSLIVSVQKGSTAGKQALEEICSLSWPPVYAYIRRRGYSVDDAGDIAQELFTRLLSQNAFAAADPDKGKLRSYLLTATKNLLAELARQRCTIKRGGALSTHPYDFAAAEQALQNQPADCRTPEQDFEYYWAMQVVDASMRDLDALNADPDRYVYYQRLRSLIVGGQDTSSYGDLAAELSVSPSALRVQVHRLRKKFRELLRQRIVDTLADQTEVDEELAYLAQCLRR